MKLDALRKQIDSVDYKIISLIARRMKIVRDIGLEKKLLGLNVRDAKREKEIGLFLDKTAVSFSLDKKVIHTIFCQIIKYSKMIQ